MLPRACLTRMVPAAAAGHALALAAGLGAALGGYQASRGMLAAAAALLLAGCLLARVAGPRARMALCAFVLSSAHGAGVALVPMLGPVCLPDGVPAAALLWPALGAALLHGAGTLALCGLLSGAWRLAAYFTSRRVSG